MTYSSLATIDDTRGTVCEPFGPTYPALANLRKTRSAPRSRAGDRAHGFAVLAAISALNARLLNVDATLVSNKGFASGTAYQDGRAILAAVRRQNRA